MKKLFVIMMGLAVLTGCEKTNDDVPQSKLATKVPKLGPVDSRGLQMSAWVDAGKVYYDIRNVSNKDVNYIEGAGGIGWWEFTHVYVKKPESGSWRGIGMRGPRYRVGAIPDDQYRILKPGETLPIAPTQNGAAVRVALEGDIPVDHSPNAYLINLDDYIVPGDLPSTILIKFSTNKIESPVLTIIQK